MTWGAVTDASSFAKYIADCQLETTMSFNDYYAVTPDLPAWPAGTYKWGIIASGGATVEIGDLATVHADPTQMRQLLQNLIGNAIKFRSPRAPTVNVYTERLADGCRLIVDDNGIGFAAEHAERIFDPFERLHGRGEYEGTGIGLALCRRIMERHGGTIHAVSPPEGGAQFIATFPALERNT